MRKQEFAVTNKDLLSLHLVTHVAEVVNATGIVPSPSSEVTTAGHKGQHYRYSPYKTRCLTKITLNQGREPFGVNILRN